MAEEIEIKKYDFIELNYTGKLKDGSVFDSTKQEIVKNAKPIKICVGLGMVIKGLDKALIGKKPTKFSVEIKPEEAFGERKSSLIKTFPVSAFSDKRMLVKGAVLNIEGVLAKVVNVAGGRVTLDLNHPLAGKTVIYDVEILKKIQDVKEKTDILAKHFLGMLGSYEISVGDNIKIKLKLKQGVNKEKTSEIIKKVEKEMKEILDKEVKIEIAQ